VFYRFHETKCMVWYLFESEASYNRRDPNRLNRIGTFCYRSYNYRTYRRTADVNYLVFTGVDLDPNAKRPWTALATTDFCGTQTWNRGDKRDFLWIYSLVHHYRATFAFDEWQCTGTRPHVYINTANHMIAPTDRNPSLTKHRWVNYAVWAGDRQEAELFGKTHVPMKFNLYSLLHGVQHYACQPLRVLRTVCLAVFDSCQWLRPSSTPSVSASSTPSPPPRRRLSVSIAVTVRSPLTLPSDDDYATTPDVKTMLLSRDTNVVAAAVKSPTTMAAPVKLPHGISYSARFPFDWLSSLDSPSLPDGLDSPVGSATSPSSNSSDRLAATV